MTPVALLMLACADPLPAPTTLHEACLREAEAECNCGTDACPDDIEAACALLDPAACEARDEAACEAQAVLAPLLADWACWVVHYEETCDPYGDDCGAA